MADRIATPHAAEPRSAVQIFGVFLRLGLTSFGGPIAHLGYFREAFVVRRRWLDDSAYAALVALCQILPGPASSQVGFAIGLREGGLKGALAAFAGFTLPSALLMFAASVGLATVPQSVRTPLFHGLMLVAAPIVAYAVIGMAQRLCNTPHTAALGVAALVVAVLANLSWLPPLLILAGGGLGAAFISGGKPPGRIDAVPLSLGAGTACLAAFAILLAGLPLLAGLAPVPAVQLADGFYRSGALVFGGGHVILPLLEAETVGRGWMQPDVFLAGYGAAQALPGPLTAFAAYLGPALPTGLPPVMAATLALAAIFAPGLLLVAGALPFWNALADRGWLGGVAAGAGAAVVGVLAAALWRPVLTTAILSPFDALIALVGLLALMLRSPVWMVVLAVTIAGVYSSPG